MGLWNVHPWSTGTGDSQFHWLFRLASEFCTAVVCDSEKEAVLALPALMVVATLLIGTPVFCEMRYAYSVFTTLPLVMTVAVYDISDNRNEGQEETLKNNENPHCAVHSG